MDVKISSLELSQDADAIRPILKSFEDSGALRTILGSSEDYNALQIRMLYVLF